MYIGKKARYIYRRIRSNAKELTFPYSWTEKRNKFIFIHVPKVAGTSISWELIGKEGGRKHLPWHVYKTANPVFFDIAFKFAFVRNPWDRALSAYRYLCRGGNGSSDLSLSRKVSQYESFSDFVVEGLGQGVYRNHLLFLPQSEFVVDEEGGVAVDFLGRYENLDSDVRDLFSKLGSKKSGIGKKNHGMMKEDYRAFYEKSEAINIVGELYKQDVNVFGYSF